MALVVLRTAKFEIYFQSLILAIHHWEMKPNKDALQILIKMLYEY